MKCQECHSDKRAENATQWKRCNRHLAHLLQVHRSSMALQAFATSTYKSGSVYRVCVFCGQATIDVYKECWAIGRMQCSSLEDGQCLHCPSSPRILGELFCKISNYTLINHACVTTSPYDGLQFPRKAFSIVAGGLH